MLSSELFLRVASTIHSSSSFPTTTTTAFFETLLSSLSYSPTIRYCTFSEPNYGNCWFTVKNQPLTNAESVIQQCVKIVAHQVAENADLYYQAIRMTALKKNCNSNNNTNTMYQHMKNSALAYDRFGVAENEQQGIHFPAVPTDRCAFAISPLPFGRRDHNKTMGEMLQLLFATSQIEGWW